MNKKGNMKKVEIEVGDYDIKILNEIFENEDNFEPRDPRDEVIIKIMKQIVENTKG